MRIALVVLMALHGIAHLPGFMVPWRLLDSPEMPYETTLLAGRVEVGGGGIRAVGVLWLLAALAFVAAAFGVWAQRGWGMPLAVGCALASLVLCALAWPRSMIGVPVNAAILLWLLLASHFGWLGARTLAG